MPAPSEEELIDVIETAAESAITALFREHPEHFYYCSLITTGRRILQHLTAWSEEALDREVAKGRSREELRWSYVDSPYFCHGEEFFGEARRLFTERPPMDSASVDRWNEEYDFRLRCMEEAMKILDNKGLFGEGEKLKNIIINVEVMPPDYTNTERARRLNPSESLTEWLATVAEDPDEDDDDYDD